MKQLILTIGFILIGFPIFAQDVILKKNAEEVQAKILKVSESEIEFKHWERPDGPTYIVPTREVFMITYQNGTKEVVSLFQDQSGKTFRQSDRFPHYQGEISAAYGLYIDEGEGTIGLETVHGARINPNLFIGTGVGVNYFYQYDEIILPVFVDAKGYLPVGMKNASLSRGGYRCSRFIRLRKYLFIFHSRSRYHVRPSRRQSTRRFKYSLSISGRKQDCTLIANRNRILRYPPVNLHTQAKFVRTKYSAHRTEEAVCKLQTASSHHPRHSIDLGPIGSSSIRSLFSGHSRANPFGPDFERYKTLQKHRLDREADYASFPSSAATDCASSERIRTCTRSSETILLRSWIATVADCVSFSGLFFRIRSINC